MPNLSPSWFLILFTFFLAFILTLVPMPDWTVWLRPAWVLLILIYWSMELPYRINVGWAWTMGIILDLLNGSLLGEHALAMTITIYIVVHMQSRLRMFSILQQSLCIFLLVLFYQFILYCVQGFIGDLPRGWLYWSTSVTSMLLWPSIYSIIRDYRRRFTAA